MRSPSAIASVSRRATWRPVSALAVSTRGRRRSFSATRRALVVEVGSRAGDVPLVEHDARRAAALHRQLGDAQVLRGDAVGGVADDERDVGALGGALRAQRRVVLDRLGRPSTGGACPAVSTSTSSRPSTSAACRSRRASCRRRSETITRSSPRKRLTSEDLPTFGRPITARRMRVLVGLVVVRRASSSTSAVEQVAGAEPLRGGHRHRLAEPEPVELGGERQVAHAVALVRGDDHRHRRAAQQVGELLVAGAHAGARVDDEHRDLRRRRAPARACSRIEPASGSRSSKSTPPVSISVNRRPFHSQSSSLRSRVTPGRSCTTASREPVRRLTSEDLPTFGIADDRDLHRSSMADERAPRPARAGPRSTRAVRTSATIRATTSPTSARSCRARPRPAAGRSGLCARVRVALVALRCSAQHRGRRRRRARARAARARAPAGSAVRNTFSSASGATTVPMSRPSATQSPAAISARCLATSAARTPGRRPPARRPRRPRACGSPRSRRAPSSSTRSPSSMPRRSRASSRRRRVGLRAARRAPTRAVHRAAVEVGEAERVRRRRARRSTCRPRRAVDRDDHARPSLAPRQAARRRSSTKPG